MCVRAAAARREEARRRITRGEDYRMRFSLGKNPCALCLDCLELERDVGRFFVCDFNPFCHLGGFFFLIISYTCLLL